ASWMIQLGVAAAKWIVAAVAIGPFGLWGATAIWCASAIDAIFRASQRPPQCERSGWMMWQARFAIRSRNCALPTRRSPVAIGMFDFWVTWRVASISSVGQGS